MGIPFLFRWIVNTCSSSIHKTILKYKKKYVLDYLGIDLNAVIHKCC